MALTDLFACLFVCLFIYSINMYQCTTPKLNFRLRLNGSRLSKMQSRCDWYQMKRAKQSMHYRRAKYLVCPLLSHVRHRPNRMPTKICHLYKKPKCVSVPFVICCEFLRCVRSSVHFAVLFCRYFACTIFGIHRCLFISFYFYLFN